MKFTLALSREQEGSRRWEKTRNESQNVLLMAEANNSISIRAPSWYHLIISLRWDEASFTALFADQSSERARWSRKQGSFDEWTNSPTHTERDRNHNWVSVYYAIFTFAHVSCLLGRPECQLLCRVLCVCWNSSHSVHTTSQPKTFDKLVFCPLQHFFCVSHLVLFWPEAWTFGHFVTLSLFPLSLSLIYNGMSKPPLRRNEP